MAKSTSSRRKREVQLSIHKPSGYWCKVLKGRRYYFEKVEDDPQGTESLDQWLEIKAGRQPKSRGYATVKDAAESWMQQKRVLLQAGEIVQDTYDEYFKTCELAFKSLGKEAEVRYLDASDFQRLRATMSKRFGPVALGKHIGQIKSLFAFAYSAGAIEAPVQFGPGFVKPAAAVIRKQRRKGGSRTSTPMRSTSY